MDKKQTKDDLPQGTQTLICHLHLLGGGFAGVNLLAFISGSLACIILMFFAYLVLVTTYVHSSFVGLLIFPFSAFFGCYDLVRRLVKMKEHEIVYKIERMTGMSVADVLEKAGRF